MVTAANQVSTPKRFSWSGGFLHPATECAVTTKGYRLNSFRTSSRKPPQLEGNFRRPRPEISLKKANVAEGFTEAWVDFSTVG
jgi:hypothetical protein